MNINAISIISISYLVVLVVAEETKKECPKYLSQRGRKYRLVVKRTENEFKTCLGEFANCVFTRDMKFYCMGGERENMELLNYKPMEVEAHYENLKENVTTTSFGKEGGAKFEIDLTGTNTAIGMRLYQKDVEVKFFRYCPVHILYYNWLCPKVNLV